MPKVTIDGRTIEVEAGTNLIEAAKHAGVQIPHYCYHPRLSIVGQCRMCLVKIGDGPKLTAACTVKIEKDGMEVHVDDPDVKATQNGMMEFLLINHPLDCPICDQAGECGLQDYSFKHGQAFSRFRFEDKRTYPGRERIPLGPNVMLNMNRCIQCTRCIRFTQEISKTSELSFFERGWRTEIGNFPGKELDNPLSTCVVDICPVGALTSTQFRFAERVWYLDKDPSLCTGCDVGCNITLEHRGGKIRRYKPRINPEVNDHWMCDFGRTTFQRYSALPRLAAPRFRPDAEEASPTNWEDAIQVIVDRLSLANGGPPPVFLGSGKLTTEEAWLLVKLAETVGSPHRPLWVETGPERTIPNPHGGVSGHDAAPNRRGAELAGLHNGTGISAKELLYGDGADDCPLLLVADSDFGDAAHDPQVIERLRRARFLVVMGWADTPLAQVADVALPTATHAEKDGTFINVQDRLQRFDKAFPPRGDVLSAVEVLTELLSALRPGDWQPGEAAAVFDRMAQELEPLSGMTFRHIPAPGVQLQLNASLTPTAAE